MNNRKGVVINNKTLKKQPKPPQEMWFWSGKSAGVWACGECNRIYQSEVMATECCKSKICKCGADNFSTVYTTCASCRHKQDMAREKDRFDKMDDITDSYDEQPVLAGDSFYKDVWEFFNCCDSLNNLEDEYIEVCSVHKLGYNISVDDVLDTLLDNVTENLEDGYEMEFDGVDVFKKQIQEFLDKQTGEIWVPCGKKINIGELVKQYGECE